ncbi:Uncharacterised protein [Mycobacteroides abscessus subsp. abscessus]|nr:Uncharacterised protein [Mycobacteroides abscessus subsp. abscessus]
MCSRFGQDPVRHRHEPFIDGFVAVQRVSEISPPAANGVHELHGKRFTQYGGDRARRARTHPPTLTFLMDSASCNHVVYLTVEAEIPTNGYTLP